MATPWSFHDLEQVSSSDFKKLQVHLVVSCFMPYQIVYDRAGAC